MWLGARDLLFARLVISPRARLGRAAEARGIFAEGMLLCCGSQAFSSEGMGLTLPLVVKLRTVVVIMVSRCCGQGEDGMGWDG